MTKSDTLPPVARERPPKFVESKRSRNACFHKRKDAFLKKAFHLSVNTDSEIVVLVRRRKDADKPPLFFASHGDVDGMYAWFKEHTGPHSETEDATVIDNSGVYEQYWLSTPPPCASIDSSSSDSSAQADLMNTDPMPEPPVLLLTVPLMTFPASNIALHDLRE